MKKLKLIVSVFLAVSMIFAFCVVANAASASVVAKANKTNVSYGDTVTVTVSLSQNSGIAGVNFVLNYDSSKLQFQSVSNGSTAGNFSMGEANNSGSTIKGAYLNTNGASTTSTGSLATVKFKVISDSASSSSLTVSANGTNGNGDPVTVSTSGTTVKINPTTKATTTKPTTTKATTTRPTTETTTKADESTTKVISTETIAVKVGNVYQLAKPSSMQGSVIFSSSNPSVISVDSNGVIKTLSRGMSTIKAVSANGVTKTWLLIVGDGSTVDSTETTTLTDEETTTELMVIGEVDEETSAEKTTAEKTEKDETKDKLDDSDGTFKLIVGVGAVVAILVIIIVVASIIRKRRNFA